ncbi:hypothetical protein Zmor_017766 [Zophobas morio]|uniref:Sodium/potassium-transporting ATPase subunit beta-2 n=1 Tax=Zophobas morio TaxID=2755281 RepID=A0AA38I5R6_9CUCU|nr:hypothetical protein Zmor_017766 [Zophobas morio]
MATKNLSEPKVQEFQFHEIPKTTKWESFQKAIYDPDKKEFFGRTKKNWYQLLIFYTIFYACLAALWAICMRGLLATLSDTEPKYQLSDSLIGTNPGLGFRPISKKTEEGSLIWYTLNQTESTKKWVDLTDEFLKPYKVDQVGKNYQACDHSVKVKKGHVCTVNLDEFGPCTNNNSYGYASSSPCVFLKLNKIFGWEPEYQTTVEEDMPKDLSVHIKNSNISNPEVWISCKGENPFDRERIGGFSYYPSHGFPGYYFPYMNDPNYLSPIIAVQIRNVLPNAIVNIECRAWAKNINYSGSRNNREGSVHFEILVDEPK